MTVGLNVAGNISSFVSTIWEDALLVARENNLAAGLVKVYNDRSGTALRANSQYGTAIINTITDADDMTSQVFTPSSLSSLTPAEAGGQFFITDTRIETDANNVRDDAALELGMAMAEKIDKDIFGDFNSLTGGTIGTSGSALTWKYFFAMMTALKTKMAPKPWVFVCHPNQWYRLGSAASIGATVTNQPELQNEFGRNFYVQTVNGVSCYTSANMEASSTDYYAAMFARPAIAYDIRRAPRLEVERDASRRGWELNLSTVYAHGVWRPTWGVQGIFAGAAPDGTS